MRNSVKKYWKNYYESKKNVVIQNFKKMVVRQKKEVLKRKNIGKKKKNIMKN